MSNRVVSLDAVSHATEPAFGAPARHQPGRHEEDAGDGQAHGRFIPEKQRPWRDADGDDRPGGQRGVMDGSERSLEPKPG